MFNIWYDVVTHKRYWRLWALKPQVKLIPYKFHFPANMGYKHETAMHKAGVGFKIGRNHLDVRKREELAPLEFEVYFLKGAFPEDTFLLPVEGHAFGHHPLAHDEEFRAKMSRFEKFKTNNIWPRIDKTKSIFLTKIR